MRTGTEFWAKGFLPKSEIFWQALMRTLTMHRRKESSIGPGSAEIPQPKLDSEMPLFSSWTIWRTTCSRTQFLETAFPAIWTKYVSLDLTSNKNACTVLKMRYRPGSTLFPAILFTDVKSLRNSGDCSSAHIINAKHSTHPSCALWTERRKITFSPKLEKS